jgi:uncharacterized membrane protein
MSFDPSIFFAALGITTLEIVEASAVGLALYGDTKRPAAFLFVALGITAVFIPLFVLSAVFAKLPLLDVKVVGGALMLYFGQRLVRSARRAVINSRKTNTTVPVEQLRKDVMVTGFSVGAIEAFEASIVLVGLLPIDFQSTVAGMGLAIGVVIVATYALKNQVRKVKQANMKVVVAALLLAFGTLWFVEVGLRLAGLLLVPLSRRLIQPSPTVFSVLTSPTSLQNLLLIPFFIVFVVAVYKFANRPSPPPPATTAVDTPATVGKK